MADYIMLFHFTEKGITHINESPQRIKKAKQLFADSGANVKACYAVLGRYDTVFIVEAPDDETIVKLSLQLGSQGNVRVETLRAFNEEQYLKMLSQMA